MDAMAQVTTARKLAIAGQLLRSRAGKSRYAGAFRRGISAAWHSLSHVFRRLWHEVTGFVFLCFAAIGGLAAFREYQRYASGADVRSRLAVALLFTAIFFWFGVTSFWRARKIKPERNCREICDAPKQYGHTRNLQR
jgi:hypothetical protein